MSDVLFLILRRLRAPLIVLIIAYAIAVIGLTFMPGQLPDGRPWKMGLFHAFYVISYTATTIGLGELPHPFSDAQRLWLTLSIYITVIAWTYTLGSIFTLIADTTFRAAISRSVFAWRVRTLADPFYVLCGYGQSARAIAHALDRMGIRVVVIESRKERASSIAIETFTSAAIVLSEDARLPKVLRDAGIYKRECRGLIALTGDDKANQAIAIGARTLRPELHVMARVKTDAARINLESFGGVDVINPFDTFAQNVALDLDHPEVLRLEEWLTATPDAACPARIGVPAGPWVIVGFGRFGQSIASVLDDRGIAWRAIDNRTLDELTDGRDRVLVAENMERALREADIEHAAVLVAGTDNDAANLAAVTLARRVNAHVWTIIRQNHIADRVLIRAAKSNLRFVQSDIMVHECLQLINEPLLGVFLKRMRQEGGAFAADALARIQARVGNGAPLAFAFACDLLQPGVFFAKLQQGLPLTIDALLLDRETGESQRALALMLLRGSDMVLLPSEDTVVMNGDRLLFVGSEESRRLLQSVSADPSQMAILLTGIEPPRTWLFRKIAAWRQARRPSYE
ncbi:MAG: hypothetical protein EAZ21_14520 [Betaproteobacteria bacterium]|nr:MAG: hypothetical protein EAZ21_14520 [Betaproteobacteria bacterium]